MVDINVEAEVVKYQGELEGFLKQLQIVKAQEATLNQAIAERRGILIYLSNLKNPPKEKTKKAEDEKKDEE